MRQIATLTANLGAIAASRGLRVLLIDLDPQTNLTFSFFSIDDWHDQLKDNRTIRQWYKAEIPGQNVPLTDLVVTPERVNNALKNTTGRLDLISSHLGLIDMDLELAAQLGGTTMGKSQKKFLDLHSCLRRALEDSHFNQYDLVLIDCAPNFGLVTKTAIVASEQILVPAKADYLSTLGLDYVKKEIRGIVTMSDVAQRYGEMATPLLQLGELDQTLRWVLSRAFDVQTVGGLCSRTVKNFDELSMGDYQRILENKDLWEKLGWKLHRPDFIARLDEIRLIRNKVMHFHPDPIAKDAIDKLQRFNNVLHQYRGPA